MKKRILFLVMAIAMASCSPTKNQSSNSNSKEVVASSEKDGTSFEKAIVINAKNEMDGVNAEYSWLRNHFPGYKMKSQSLSSKGSKSYDVLHFLTSEGKEMTIYFDITKFFGKL
jgi:hypothetical protein